MHIIAYISFHLYLAKSAGMKKLKRKMDLNPPWVMQFGTTTQLFFFRGKKTANLHLQETTPDFFYSLQPEKDRSNIFRPSSGNKTRVYLT